MALVYSVSLIISYIQSNCKLRMTRDESVDPMPTSNAICFSSDTSFSGNAAYDCNERTWTIVLALRRNLFVRYFTNVSYGGSNAKIWFGIDPASLIEPMIDNAKVTIIRSRKGKFKLEFTFRKFLFLRDLRRGVRNTAIVLRVLFPRHALFPRDRVLFFWLLQIVSTRPHDAQLRNDQPKHVVFRTAVAMRVMYRL